MKFGYTIFYVESVEGTIAFYEKAFGLKRDMVMEGEFGQLATGATKLGFAAKKMPPVPVQYGTADKPLAAEIALVTDNVQAAFDKAVAAGAKPVKKPAQKPWGQIVGYVQDNNGLLIEICTPVG